MRWLFLIFASMLIFALLLIGNTVSPSQIAAFQATETPPPSVISQIPERAIDDFTLPDVGLSGGLLFTNNANLVMARFDGQSPSVLSDTGAILAFNIHHLPDDTILFTDRDSARQRYGFAQFDLMTNTNTVLDLEGGAGFVMSWSEDGTWVLIDGREIGLLEVATGLFRPLPIQRTYHQGTGVAFPYIDLIWLRDNSVIYLERDDELLSRFVTHYDPVNDVATGLDIRFDQLPLNFTLLDLENELMMLGYNVAATNTLYDTAVIREGGETRFVIRQPLSPSRTRICETWTIENQWRFQGTSEVIYTADDTHALMDLHLLRDGSVVFVRWYKHDCNFSTPLSTELVRLWPNGETEIVATNIKIGTTQVTAVVERHRIAVSPDGYYVVWVTEDNRILLWDSISGQSTTLLSSTTTFGSVQWVYP